MLNRDGILAIHENIRMCLVETNVFVFLQNQRQTKPIKEINKELRV